MTDFWDYMLDTNTIGFFVNNSNMISLNTFKVVRNYRLIVEEWKES